MKIRMLKSLSDSHTLYDKGVGIDRKIKIANQEVKRFESLMAAGNKLGMRITGKMSYYKPDTLGQKVESAAAFNRSNVRDLRDGIKFGDSKMIEKYGSRLGDNNDTLQDGIIRYSRILKEAHKQLSRR